MISDTLGWSIPITSAASFWVSFLFWITWWICRDRSAFRLLGSNPLHPVENKCQLRIAFATPILDFVQLFPSLYWIFFKKVFPFMKKRSVAIWIFSCSSMQSQSWTKVRFLFSPSPFPLWRGWGEVFRVGALKSNDPSSRAYDNAEDEATGLIGVGCFLDPVELIGVFFY